MKRLFEKLGGTKKASASSVKGATVRQEPVGVEEETLNKRYTNFMGMVNDIADFPEYGAKLLNVLMGSEKLFGRFICDQEMLAKLIAIVPTRAVECIDNMLNFPRCWGALLTSPKNLRETVGLFKSPDIQDKILSHVFSHRPIYAELVRGQTSLNTVLEHFPGRKKEIMEILATDARVFQNCVVTTKEHFWKMMNDNPDYKERFFDHIVTDQPIYKELVGGTTSIYSILTAFPHRQDELIHFVAKHEAMLLHEFPGFSMIDEFCRKYPQYRDELFDAALAIPSYPRREISTWGRLIALYGYSPKHALAAEAMIIRDPDWVLEVVTFTQDFAQLCEEDIFKDLKRAFLQALCLSPKKFTFHVDNESGLNKMITIVPDQEWKLRVYYQLHTVKTPLAEIIQALYTETVVIDTLTDYVAHCMKMTPLDPEAIKSSRKMIASLLETLDAGTAEYVNLQTLDKALAPLPSASQVATMAKNFPKEKTAGETSSEGALVQPTLPPGWTKVK